MIPEAPCRGCTERKLRCHSSCYKYVFWKQKSKKLLQSSENFYKAGFSWLENGYNRQGKGKREAWARYANKH